MNESFRKVLDSMNSTNNEAVARNFGTDVNAIKEQISKLQADYGLSDEDIVSLMESIDNLEEPKKSRTRDAYQDSKNVKFEMEWDDSFLDNRREAALFGVSVPDGLDEKQRAHFLAIAGMPEDTPEQVLAKGMEIHHFLRPDDEMTGPVAQANTFVDYMYVANFHRDYDSDKGAAWRQQELEKPLDGISQNINAETGEVTAKCRPQIVEVDMSSFGLKEELGGVLYAVSHGHENVETEAEEESAGKGASEGASHETTSAGAAHDGAETTGDVKEQAEESEQAESAGSTPVPEGSVPEGEGAASPEAEGVSNPPMVVEFVDEDSKLATGERGTGLDDNGIIHYDGELGKFDYNPAEFRVMVVTVEPRKDAEGNVIEGTGGQFPILRYIGDEVDGSKINIPEGLKDGALMFDGNENLRSAPRLPASLESAFGMFRDCTSMTLARQPIPSNVQDTQFMFAGCRSLTRGPSEVPGTVKDATAMFANCDSMIVTPKLKEGIECTDSMFANCKSLEKKPSVPSSVKYADSMTAGCIGIDKSEHEKWLKSQDKAKAKLEKDMNRKTLGDHIGSVFSAIMQARLEKRTTGCTLLAAMYMTHQKRKSGALDKSAAAGWEAAARMMGKKNLAYVVARTAASNGRNHQAAQERANSLKRESFAATTFGGKESSADDRLNWMTGRSAGASGYFERVGKNGYPMSATVRTDLKNACDSYRNLVESFAAGGDLSPRDKKYFAKEMMEMMSNQTSYYRGAASSLRDCKDPELAKLREKGINTVSVANMGSLFELMAEMQEKHQLFNERQLNSMVLMAQSTPYYNELQSPKGKELMSRMYGQFAPTEDVAKQRLDDMTRSNSREGYAVRHGDRGAEAARRFNVNEPVSAGAEREAGA